jgi:hypothetical protein
MVVSMSDEHIDPSGNTEAFQAFARRTGFTEPQKSSSVPKVAVAAGMVATVILVAAVIWYFIAS